MGSDPWTPLRLCSGDLTAPPDPQLARAMTFPCRHDIIIRLGGIFQFGFDKKIIQVLFDVCKQEEDCLLQHVCSCKDGKILLNGVIKLLRVGRLE